jgi:hypothetical protein
VVAAVVVFGFAYLGSIIPRASTTMFASPDETATAIFADAFGRTGAFRIPVTTTSTLHYVVSLHPRSMVRQGDWLVPVGFLGMPFLAWLADVFSPHAASFLTLILVLSSLIPLYFLLRPLGRWAAWSSLAVFASFPTVLLYENRGLFPNLSVVALTIWSLFLFKKLEVRSQRLEVISTVCAFLGGLTFALAVAIRPTELIWMLPWAIWAFCSGTRSQNGSAYHLPRTAYLLMYGLILLPIILISIGFTILSMRTYPFNASLKTQPAIGYFMKDRGQTPQQASLPDKGGTEGGFAASRSLSSLWTGIHPRVMWRNASLYLGGLLGPWLAIAAMGVAWFIRKKKWTRDGTILVVVSAWTAGVLFLLYGQTLYADNINQTATIGNSFLRYMLPLAPLLALCCGLLMQIVRDRFERTGTFFAGMCCLALVATGCSLALTADAESVLPTRNQVLEYVDIRKMTDTDVPPGAIILSERDDKIFASGLTTAVSPLPSVDDLKNIAASHAPVFFYHRRITGPESVPPPMVEAFHQNPWVEVFRIENEALYRIDGVLPPI